MILLLTAVTLLLAGGAVHYVAALIADGRLKVNPSFGIRTKYTMANEEAWRAGHKAANTQVRAVASTFYVASAGIVAILTVDYFGILDLTEDARDLIVGLWVITCCIVAIALVVRAARVANAAARPFVEEKGRAGSAG